MSKKNTSLHLKRKKTYDLPLDRNSGGWLMAWIIGLMTYLSIIILLTILGLNAVTTHWQSGLKGRMTIEISHDIAEKSPQQIEKLIDELNTQENVIAIRVDDTTLFELISPWLGDISAVDDLPLPALIDIQAENQEIPLPSSTIKGILSEILPQAHLDTHQKWIDQIITISYTLKTIFSLLGLIIFTTSIGAVIGACRTFLALKSEEVSILHLIGANDSYIAKQFQKQSFRLALEGSLGGLLLITLSLWSITYAFGDTTENMILPDFHLSFWHWAAIFFVPFSMAFIALITSRLTVLWTLKRLI